jgi:hypothetical protein
MYSVLLEGDQTETECGTPGLELGMIILTGIHMAKQTSVVNTLSLNAAKLIVTAD